jgi:hypothetical protein
MATENQPIVSRNKEVSMFILFLALTGLSVMALIVGTAWTAVVFGQTRRRSGPEVGAEMQAERMARDSVGHLEPQHVFFKGKAVAVERKANLSFAEIKQQLMAGEWLQMFPVLLAMGGLLGLFLFGSAAAWLGIENKLVAGLIAIVALYAIIRTVSAFARA